MNTSGAYPSLQEPGLRKKNKADGELEKLKSDKSRMRLIKQKMGVSTTPRKKKKAQWVGDNVG